MNKTKYSNSETDIFLQILLGNVAPASAVVSAPAKQTQKLTGTSAMTKSQLRKITGDSRQIWNA